MPGWVEIDDDAPEIGCFWGFVLILLAWSTPFFLVWLLTGLVFDEWWFV